MIKQVITFVLETDIDSSTLLDIAHQLEQVIIEQVESYGVVAVCIEDETSVETK